MSTTILIYKKERETMDSIRLTKEANAKQRSQWLYQTKENRTNDMSAGKAAARARRNAKAERLADLQDAVAKRANSKSGN